MGIHNGPKAVTYICGGEEFALYTEVPLDHRFDTCPDAARHAPMPAGYMGNSGAAERRIKARQRNKLCPGCDRWVIWTGGKDVPGWPRYIGEPVQGDSETT
jgi:hypothetical protein